MTQRIFDFIFLASGQICELINSDGGVLRKFCILSDITRRCIAELIDSEIDEEKDALFSW